MKFKLKRTFKRLYKEKGAIYFSPGRVNLIGEHIDYHGGYVLPATISLGTYGVVSKRNDNLVQVFSTGFTTEVTSFSLDSIKKEDDWLDYVKGVFVIMQKAGYKITSGLNLYINSTLPAKAGLSSSSSLELLIIKMLNDLFSLDIDKKRQAELGQLVENDFIGVKSGIMDQFAISHGKKGHALFLNSSTLDFEYVPVILKGYDFLIVNTNKDRELADGKYNERYTESMEALCLLKPHFKIKNLVDLAVTDLEKAEEILNDDLLYRRVKHVVTEQNRTIRALEAIKNKEIKAFGELLYASHASLRDDYEVTGAELDLIIDLAEASEAVGARMTGAGFGGCAVLLTLKSKTGNTIKHITKEYTKKFRTRPDFLMIRMSDGTKKVT
ncbi:MAG TPA: galactokinase [Bacilli bacterium]|nr:galactokinase [Bacilli bacterium]